MDTKEKKKYENFWAYLMLAVMLLSLLPVMYLGRYNHPTGDDYDYGAVTKHVWEETGSLAATVAEAAKGVAYQYENWQGTYSAMFLMYLPPNIFGDTPYRLVTCVMLTLLCGGIFCLLKQLLCGLLRTSRELWLISASLLTLLCVQTVPSQGETFFWYNGSMYYTGYFAMTLFMFGMLLRYVTAPKKHHIPVLAVLAVFLAGGNYVSLLPAILISVLLTAVLIYRKSKRAWGPGCVTIFMTAGLLISAAAPGNAVRQSGMWKISAHMAVIKSFIQGFNYMRAWIGIWWIVAAVIMLPFLWRAFSKMTFPFPYPLPAVGLAYGIFCSMSCPTFYTMNSTGPARVVSIVYYGFILFSFFCYVYLMGYLYRRMEERHLQGRPVKRLPWLKGGMVVIVVLLIMMQVVSGGVKQMTTVKAVELLATGEAQAYEQEYQERMDILEDPSIKDVVFAPYKHQPDMLYVGDTTGDAAHPVNVSMANYFDKNSIYVAY